MHFLSLNRRFPQITQMKLVRHEFQIGPLFICKIGVICGNLRFRVVMQGG